MSEKPPQEPSPAEPPRSAVFLASFNRAERALRGLTGEQMPFRQIISVARRSHPVVRRCYDDLVELSELRNAIVHDSTEPASVIAEPAESAVQLMQTIADLLERPPALIPLFEREVARISETDPLYLALGLMVAKGYAQLPVYDARARLMGLLTERTIARWYARSVVGGRPIDAEVPVGALLKQPDGRDLRNYSLMPADATVFDAEDKFLRNRHLEAIIITATGQTDEEPIGIITDGDIARLPPG